MIVDHRMQKWLLKTAYGLAQRHVRVKASGNGGRVLIGIPGRSTDLHRSDMQNAGSWPLTNLSRHRVGVAN